MKSYWNLMQPSTPNFQHNGSLIIIGDDNPNLYIEAGTYTNNLYLTLSPLIASPQTISITP